MAPKSRIEWCEKKCNLMLSLSSRPTWTVREKHDLSEEFNKKRIGFEFKKPKMCEIFRSTRVIWPDVESTQRQNWSTLIQRIFWLKWHSKARRRSVNLFFEIWSVKTVNCLRQHNCLVRHWTWPYSMTLKNELLQTIFTKIAFVRNSSSQRFFL